MDYINREIKGFNEGKKPRLSFYNPDYFKNIRYFEKTFPDKVISSAIFYDGVTSDSGDPMSGIYNFRDCNINI